MQGEEGDEELSEAMKTYELMIRYRIEMDEDLYDESDAWQWARDDAQKLDSDAGNRRRAEVVSCKEIEEKLEDLL